MGMYLYLDDVVAGHPKAQHELDELRAVAKKAAQDLRYHAHSMSNVATIYPKSTLKGAVHGWRLRLMEIADTLNTDKDEPRWPQVSNVELTGGAKAPSSDRRERG